MALSKEQILVEIKRTAKENGGKPLGKLRFVKETGIGPYDWQRYWTQFGKAQQEAGLSPNQLNVAYSDELLFEKIISLAYKLNRLPTAPEIRIEKINNPEFPDNKTFIRAFGSKQKFALKLAEHCKDKKDYTDVIKWCKDISEKTDTQDDSEDESNNILGAVYIFKSGRYYKIGKTKDTVRRGSELKIQLPEDLYLIHEIKTDDPSGVENYWHKRFESKRMKGEWFDLNSSEIKAFKRWKRIV